MHPAPLPTSVLGQIVRTFKPSQINVLAGAVLGLLLLTAAGALVALAPQLVDKSEDVTLVYVLGAACVTGGVMLIAFTIRLTYAKVDLCEGGFRSYSAGSVDQVTWEQVDLIQLHVEAKEGAHADPSITVMTERGRTYHFTANHVTRMTSFVKILGELTSGYDNLWEVTSQASKRRFAIFLIVGGLFVMVMSPLTFMDIAQAEQNAGGKPVKVHAVVYLLYQVGGKWLAAVGMFLLGLACTCWGLVAFRKDNSPTPRGRKKKRLGHTSEAEPV